MLVVLSYARGEFDDFSLAVAATSSNQWMVILSGVLPNPSKIISSSEILFAKIKNKMKNKIKIPVTSPNIFLSCFNWYVGQCVTGTLIGWAGWYCRDLVSATSYTIIGVANKILTVCLRSFKMK